jgi:hypothetical protein
MNIAEELNAKGATPETILQILKNSVFEISGDLTPEEMRSELRNAVQQPHEVDRALRELETQPELVKEIALLWIAAAADDPNRRGPIEGAIAGADREMPMLEIGAITLVALYAIYMIGPNKPLRTEKTLTYRPDGGFEEREVTSFASFDGPIRALLGLFTSPREGK